MVIQAIMIILLIPSVIIHEIAHGWIALKLGDPTAKHLGRLTVNPIPHIDLMGSIIIPAMLIITGAPFLIGWAKPVPINPRYFKNSTQGMMWVALAGPISNIVIASVAGMLLRAIPVTYIITHIILILVTQINLILAFFNLVPVPPLDGSRVLHHFAPPSLKRVLDKVEPYGILVIATLSYFGLFAPYIRSVVTPIYQMIVP